MGKLASSPSPQWEEGASWGIRSRHLGRNIPFLRAGCGAEKLWGALGETKAKVRQTIEASCPTEKSRPRGRSKYTCSREKPLETKGLNQRLKVGLRDHFIGYYGVLQASTGWMKRDKEGEGTVNGTAYSLFYLNFSKGKSKNYGI